MRNTDFAVCEQQRCRSDCAYAQSDRRLCYSLSGKDGVNSFYMPNFRVLASLGSSVGWFESYLARNPEEGSCF